MNDGRNYVQQLKKITQTHQESVREKQLEVYKETLGSMKPYLEHAARQGRDSVDFNIEQKMFLGITLKALRGFLESDGFFVTVLDAIGVGAFRLSWEDRLTVRGGLFPAPEDVVYKS